jgi:hypothetical protein
MRRRLAPTIVLIAATAAFAARAEESPEAIKNARKRFQEGVAAMDAKKYEEARVLFQQAYTLKPHPSVLRNLGQAELRAGHWVEAARHLSSFLRDTSFGTAEEREATQQALVEAEAKVGKIVVDVDVGGAEIAIDGEIVGRSPMAGAPLYGEPGQRTLRVRKDGYFDHESSARLEAGQSANVAVALRRAAPDTAAPFASAATVAPAPVEPPRSPARVKPGIVIAGGAVAAAGIAAGIVLRVSAASKIDDRDAVYAGLAGGSVCGSSTPFSGACAQAQELNADSVRQRNLSTAGFIVGGVSAAATIAYVLWPRAKSGVTTLAPTLSRQHAGLQLRSTF